MQCPDTAKPPGGVSERTHNRTDRQTDGKERDGIIQRRRKSRGENREKMLKVEEEKQTEERNRESVLIEKHQRAGDRGHSSENHCVF